jgi:hypothetical protein
LKARGLVLRIPQPGMNAGVSCEDLIKFEALDGWPNEYRDGKSEYERCRFKATWSKTKALLMRELEKVGAKGAVLMTGHYPRDITREGLPRVDARSPRFPGVVVAFQKWNLSVKRYDVIQFPCETYDHWEDNLRAIALSMEALRAVDRYGVTRHSEQYAGWTKKVESRAGVQGGKLSPESAALVLAACASASGEQFSSALIQSDECEMERSYKVAAKEVHPDVGGSEASMAKVNEARKVMQEYFRSKAKGTGA